MTKTKITVGYNVYYAPDGSDPSFIGFADTIEDAREMAGQGGLPKSQWDTARAAGHCAGISAPEGEEAEEPNEWFGDDGWYCAVRVLRDEKVYTARVHVHDGSGCSEDLSTTWDESYSRKEIEAEARTLAEEWVQDGDWGDDGARIDYSVTITDSNDDEWVIRGTVEIEPDHDALIKAAGGDPNCDHEWSSEGHGGCSENPGVWSTGGTSMVFKSHCTLCGLHRTEHHTGSQRNPGEHDTVEYSMPDEEWVEEHIQEMVEAQEVNWTHESHIATYEHGDIPVSCDVVLQSATLAGDITIYRWADEDESVAVGDPTTDLWKAKDAGREYAEGTHDE